MHEIDLSNISARCDLIAEVIEEREIEGISKVIEHIDDIKVERVSLNKAGAKKLDKKVGEYITISFDDVTDYSNRDRVIKVVTKELKGLFDLLKLDKKKKALIVGIGNRLSTPDSLGPRTINSVVVTRHLFELSDVGVEENYSNVSILEPNVYASTGIESFDIISSVVKRTKPDYIIAIDALAASSIDRVNKTIQITDTGISPGAGVGNFTKELSSDTLKIPVIAVGVPTVVDAVTIVGDTINYLIKKLSYSIMNADNPVDKIKNPNSINYLDTNMTLDLNERENFLGEIGKLEEEDIRALIFEVLTPIGYNLVVTPKEVDFLIEKLAITLATSINNTLHDLGH